MIKKIVFFNHFHNGDIFASKEYIRQIINSLPNISFEYSHGNSEKLLKDLEIGYSNINSSNLGVTPRTKFFIVYDTLLINTWIGNYLEKETGVNWITYNYMFNQIYKYLRDTDVVDIKKKNVYFYIPTIDFKKFDIPTQKIKAGTILLSNGPSLSGQSDTLGFDGLINEILEKTDRNIILTHDSIISDSRIQYTNNIIKASNGDLNEISYVAEQCDILIGRNSGPFCFMHTKSILNDSNKTLISIGNGASESFVFGMKTLCNYYFINDKDKTDVDDQVMEKIL